MKLERSKNAKRSIFFGVVNKSATFLLMFILRTLIIHVLGSEYLGLDSLFSSILKVLSMSELGFGSAVVYNMYKPIAENDTETLEAILGFYRKVYATVGMIILVGGLVLLPFVPKLISGSYPSDINIYLLYLMFLSNSCLSYFLFAYKNSLLNAYQRMDVNTNMNTIAVLICYSAQIVIILTTKNYYLYTGMMLVSTVINNLLIAYYVGKLFPDIRPRGGLSKEKRKDIIEKVKGLMLEKVCGTSRNSFDSIFLSAFLGLTQTAIYNNYYYISNAIAVFMNLSRNALLGGVGNSIQLDSEEKNYHDMSKLDFIYMWIAGWAMICLLCLFQPFTALVWGEDMLFPFHVVVVFCLYFYALRMSDMRTIYASACGLWWENRHRAIAEALCNLILNYVLGKCLGALGIVLATLISVLLFNFLWGSTIIFQKYFKHQSITTYFLRHAFYGAATMAACLVTYFLCSLMRGGCLIQVIGRAGLCILVPNGIYFLIYRKTKLYGEAIPWLKRILGKNR